MTGVLTIATAICLAISGCSALVVLYVMAAVTFDYGRDWWRYRHLLRRAPQRKGEPR